MRTLRFPILWESVAPRSAQELDWSWPDAQLAWLREAGVRPIAGLLHHGSGPRFTSLVDPEFPRTFAAFAGAVARRYPWVDAYTPINEPLTTARFSGLYGHWFPHGRDDATFVCALLNQCRAITLAMHEIRKVNPNAILVQTDDLGRTFSTPRLRHQALFDNERRWLAWDLVRGEVGPGHTLWNYLRENGADDAALDSLGENPCPADVIGINHYVTSDRYLDERLEDYPPETHGANRWERYADDAAVRTCVQVSGFAGAIRDAHDRYRTPLALTEVHLGSAPAEQLRWLAEAWDAATDARTNGVDLRAVTAWSLLGSFDWDSLVTQPNEHYEPGAFDISDGEPRATLLAEAIAALARGEALDFPELDECGWWRQPFRLRESARRRLAGQGMESAAA